MNIMERRTEFSVSGGDINHTNPMKVEYLSIWSEALQTNISITVERDRPFAKDPEEAVLVLHIDQPSRLAIIDGFGDTQDVFVR